VTFRPDPKLIRKIRIAATYLAGPENIMEDYVFIHRHIDKRMSQNVRL